MNVKLEIKQNRSKLEKKDKKYEMIVVYKLRKLEIESNLIVINRQINVTKKGEDKKKTLELTNQQYSKKRKVIKIKVNQLCKNQRKNMGHIMNQS